MRRTLPTESEAREILARRRTRPPLRPPPPAGRSLAPLIRQLDDRFGKGAGALETRWREIVGDRLAAVTRPQKLTKGRGGAPGVLELRVAGPAALLVQHQSAEILSRVNLFLGAGAVDRLRIAQGPVKPLPKAAAPARPRATPLPASVEREIEASVEGAPDDLKAALSKLARAVHGHSTTR
ncbi:hypothetical protein ASG17_05345 [Brevundimonas sp. Leaf363]|uniref:DUF721 domain-containing protein n=1 Tax=Brevundimonas sp. Leaf363 TaxID=1736353 RepID=UPI0006FC21AE|nr:DciA family protein [Brevundimonas sp. Leaf363]KQS55505.1 hypothetical protein ASG17_05345 [Brevundimonas sp. Leaf363]